MRSTARIPTRILTFASNHPLTIFQTTVAALHPTALASSLLLVTLAMIVEWEILVSGYFHYGRTQLEDVISVRKQFDGCEFHKIDVNEVLTKEDIEQLEFRKAFDIFNRIKIYVVRQPGLGPSPSKLGAISALKNEYIFVRDHPSELNGVGKFPFKHELGHVSILNDFFKLQQIQVYFFYIFLFWLAAQLFNSVTGTVILALMSVYAVLNLVCRQYIQSILNYLPSEQYADYFGLCALTIDERMAVSRFYLKDPERLPIDTEMTKEFNSYRHEFLRSMLLAIERDPLAPLVAPPFPIGWAAMWWRGVTMILLSFVTRPPDIGIILWSLFLAFYCFLILIWNGLWCRQADLRLSKLLATPNHV